MKLFFLSLVFSFAVSGCAALKLSDFGLADLAGAGDQEIDFDPVATAAARVRSPANATSSGYERQDYAAPLGSHLSLGMSMGQVIALWGDPSDVESAGDSRQGNQRWTYFSGLSSRWSVGARRVVYFESGRVAGWNNGH
jgi:hypothetical protein